MQEVWKKRAAVAFLVFLCLWLVGIVRSYAQPATQLPPWPLPNIEEFTARVQAANNLKQIGMALTPLPLVLEQAAVDQIQIYEKVAQLAAGTVAFDEDAAQIRAALTAHQAVVLNEKTTGIAPERRLTLEIGVPPDKFDALVEQLEHIGRLDSVSLHQRDRTSEFRRLHSQRQSLKKYQEAVLKLRGANNPSIDDTLKLEQRIQEIEKELQALSVQFGEMLGKESFYHVLATLYEYQPGGRHDRSLTLTRRLGHAFLWALSWWCTIAAAVGVLAATVVSIQTLWAKTSASGTERPREQPAT